MFQTTQQLAEKGTHETVCHGISVNAICYMVQRRKCRTQYGNKSSAYYKNATILCYLHPTLNHTVFTYNISHCSIVARYIALLSSEVIDFIIFFALVKPCILNSCCIAVVTSILVKGVARTFYGRGELLFSRLKSEQAKEMACKRILQLW